MKGYKKKKVFYIMILHLSEKDLLKEDAAQATTYSFNE